MSVNYEKLRELEISLASILHFSQRVQFYELVSDFRCLGFAFFARNISNSKAYFVNFNNIVSIK